MKVIDNGQVFLCPICGVGLVWGSREREYIEHETYPQYPCVNAGKRFKVPMVDLEEIRERQHD